jgi:hypothetical protein
MRRRPSSRASLRTSPPRSAALRAPASSRARLVTPTHYALARHRPTRCLWVFALQGESVVGVCGPLEGDAPPSWLLPHFDFESGGARTNLPVIRANLAEFDRLA